MYAQLVLDPNLMIILLENYSELKKEDLLGKYAHGTKARDKQDAT